MSVDKPQVAIIGGGLAGLAAASALCEDAQVTLFEAKRQLGGRAGSFQEPLAGELVDHCQHVSMGCCTNLADFCRRTGIERHLRRYDTLYFIAPNGTCHSVTASRYLSAPLHLASALLRLNYLGLSDRIRIARGLLTLTARWSSGSGHLMTARQWLEQHGQTPQAIQQFWDVILVSALGESTQYASVSAARQVFRDGFMASQKAFELYVPDVPLGDFYGSELEAWLAAHGVTLQLSSPIRQLDLMASGQFEFLSGAGPLKFQHVVLAVPWRRVWDLLGPQLRGRLAQLEQLSELEASPISGVHLWFDRPITQLPHAVLVGRLSQWIFARGRREESDSGQPSHYYQVVISASRELAGRPRDVIVESVCEDLRSVFPGAHGAKLLHGRVVTDPVAVFSVRPGTEAKRPDQRTGVPGLYLAGDWTATGWPATMEGAVRSGYRAAEYVLASLGEARQVVVPDLKRSRLARLLLSQ